MDRRNPSSDPNSNGRVNNNSNYNSAANNNNSNVQNNQQIWRTIKTKFMPNCIQKEHSYKQIIELCADSRCKENNQYLQPVCIFCERDKMHNIAQKHLTLQINSTLSDFCKDVEALPDQKPTERKPYDPNNPDENE